MAEDVQKNNFNEIVERPVDIFYGGMTQIIYLSLNFKNLPETNCVNYDSLETFLRNTWDEHFPEIDNILDFLRYCVYHTGMIGRFFKTNCILSLDDVISFLNGRLPNPDDSFRVWHKLHKIANLILKEVCKESESNVTLILDLHTSTNSTCDSIEDKIKLFNLEAVPNKEERVLLYHITICYDSNNDSKLKGCADLANLKSLSNVNDNFANFEEKCEISKISKSISSQNQYDSFHKSQMQSKEIYQWQKYGARPKNKAYSLNDHKNIENKELSDTSLKSYSDVGNLKGFDSSVNTKAHLNDIAPVSSLSELQPQGSKSDLIFPFSFIPVTLEDEKGWQKCSIMPKDKQEDNCKYAKKSCVMSERKRAILLNHSPIAPTEFSEASGHDKFITPRFFSNVQSKEEKSSQSFYLRDALSENETQIRRQWRQCSSRTNTAIRRKMLDANYKIARNSNYKPDTQENFPFQLPFINLQSQNTQENLACNDVKNSSFDTSTNEYHFQVRESILRYEIETFFKSYRFSDVCLDDIPSLRQFDVSNDPLIKPGNVSLSTDVKLNSVPMVDRKNSPDKVADDTDQTNKLSHVNQNSGHLAINKFDDKISFNWEHLLKTETSIIGNPNPIPLQEIPAEKTEDFSKNKIVFLDGEPMPSENTDDFYGTFFKDIVQQLTDEKPFDQKVLPDHPRSLQSSTPEKNSKLANFEKAEYERMSQESLKEMSSANEIFSERSDETSKQPDLDNSPDFESISDA